MCAVLLDQNNIILSIKNEKKYSNLNVSELARKYCISRRSVNRILNDEVK